MQPPLSPETCTHESGKESNWIRWLKRKTTAHKQKARILRMIFWLPPMPGSVDVILQTGMLGIHRLMQLSDPVRDVLYAVNNSSYHRSSRWSQGREHVTLECSAKSGYQIPSAEAQGPLQKSSREPEVSENQCRAASSWHNQTAALINAKRLWLPV